MLKLSRHKNVMQFSHIIFMLRYSNGMMSTAKLPTKQGSTHTCQVLEKHFLRLTGIQSSYAVKLQTFIFS